MKTRTLWLLAAALLVLAGCAGTGGEDRKTAEIRLTDLYDSMAAACGWEDGYMAELEGDLLEGYYPGLSQLDLLQCVARIPAMSSDVNEILLLQCGTETAAEEAEDILQARIDSQLGGGAWYAETREAWEQAAVLRQGNYAALLASGAHQAVLAEQWDQAFT